MPDAKRNTRLEALIASECDLPDGASLYVYDSVDSTNDLLRSFAENGAAEGTVIAARQQTAGKGRQGRAFFSPPDTGLYLSMLLRPHCTPQEVLSLTPMAAVAAAMAVETLSGEQTAIKWVNDLLLHDRKICGILCESKFTQDSPYPEYVIAGTGINLIMPQEGFPPALREIAGAVLPAGTDPEPAFCTCAAALIRNTLSEYRGLASRHYLSGYRARLCSLNRPILVLENGVEHAATALMVDDDLRLLVRYADGREEWRSTGEIRIRNAAI